MSDFPQVATDILVMIPARNEAATLSSVISAVKNRLGLAVVVVNDASLDETPNVAEEAGAVVLSLAVRLGAWGATQTALRYAERKGFGYAVSMDADAQHDSAHIPLLLTALDTCGADVIIGSCTERGSRLRKMAWILLKMVSGLRLEDVTSGFRVYNRRAIELLASKEASMFDYQDVGVLVFLQSKGLKIVDVPIQMQPRINGISRIFSSWLTVLYYMYYTLVLGLSKRGVRAVDKITSIG